MNKKLTIILVVVAVLVGGNYYYAIKMPEVIGGERDRQGCLAGAGYAFDERVGACARSFELTPDIANAGRLAVEKLGRGNILTLVSFNSYEDGTYEITLEEGIERIKRVFRIINGVAIEQ